MRVGGETQNRVGSSDVRSASKSLPAARKWPMLVMQLPKKTSSIAVPATALRSTASSGSFGAQSTGSSTSARSMSMVAA